nr:MAG TPA: hypothetical protein [Caudoviricetes sp.]
MGRIHRFSSGYLKRTQAGLEITCTQSRVYFTSSPAIFEIHSFSKCVL